MSSSLTFCRSICVSLKLSVTCLAGMFTCTCCTPGCSPSTWVMVRSQCSQEISGTANFSVAIFVLSFVSLGYGCPSTSTRLEPAAARQEAAGSRLSGGFPRCSRAALISSIHGDGPEDRGVVGTLFDLVEASLLSEGQQQATDVVSHLFEVAEHQSN